MKARELRIGVALSSIPQFQAMAKLARDIEESECIIRKHRGKHRIDELKHQALTTVYSYQTLTENEVYQIEIWLRHKNYE